ncbi:MAG TPA: glycosyltransferase family 39 protein [Vicinamibacterales bacterium]|nr:glycosyltransferase family 39 protein [Vicinamibacterales bacterium]
MFALLASALLVGYLPGALVYRYPAWERSRRAAVAAEERVFWAVLLSTVWSVMVVLALAGLDEYRFERLLWINGGLSLALVALGRGRLHYGGDAPRVTAGAVVPAALVVAACWQLLPPAEYAMGGKDPGVYINEGIQIAQRGTFIYRDPVVAAVPEPFRDLFFPKGRFDEYYAQRFMGYFIRDPDTGDVIGQFPHGFPASIALGYGLNGLSGARQTVVFWSVLSLVAIYLTAARIFGRLAAFAGVALLALHVVEIWWGKYPNVEVATRALLFGSLLAFSRATDGDRPFFGVVAGALAGLPLFFRYDAILTIAAVLAAAVLVVANRQRVGWAFGVSLAVTGAAGTWYMLVPMWAYSSPYFSFSVREGGFVPLAAAGLLGARLLLGRDAWAAPVRRLLPPVLAVTMAALAGYAYFLREPGGTLAIHDAIAFRQFAWYLTPLGMLAAVVAFVVAIRQQFWSAPALFVTIVVHATFFFYKTRIVPQHFWTSRRFLTVIIPAALVLIAALATRVLDPQRWRRSAPLHAGLVALALAPLGWAFWQASAPVRAHVEYAGLIPKIEAMAAALGDRDLLLVEARGTGSDLHVLALPLAYIYDRQVLVLFDRAPDPRVFADFVRWAAPRYDRVLYMGGTGSQILSLDLLAEPLGEDRFWVPEYDSPVMAYPTDVRLKEFDYGLYVLRADATAARGPIDLPVGSRDRLYVRHFYTPEQHASTGEWFRWTRSSAEVLVLGVSPAATEAVVWMSRGGRPAAAPEPVTTISLDGVTLGTAVPDEPVQPFRFPLPPGLVDRLATRDVPAPVRIESSTWNPQQLLGVNDPRDLGVLVTRIEIR